MESEECYRIRQAFLAHLHKFLTHDTWDHIIEEAHQEGIILNED